MEIKTKDIVAAFEKLKGVVTQTPLLFNYNISEQHKCTVYLKREDLQIVRSYKIRGAFNKISSLTAESLKKGIVCASAGNHAQGVAFSCAKLGVMGKIYMPLTTPSQKIQQVEMFGKNFIDIILCGNTFDDCFAEAMLFAQKNKMDFIHPFDDKKIIEGQGTVALEILQKADFKIDYLFVPIGGGGLASGVSSYFREFSPKTKIIGVQPQGAPSMKISVEKNSIMTLDKIDTFVDGASVKKPGKITFEICKNNLDDIITVPEGKICTTILKMYNKDAIVAEPAGALSVSALDFYEKKIKNKNVVCIVSGSNNDITRMEEIKEKSMLYEGLKHYFIINFPQRAGALMEFLTKVLGPNDDISYFTYAKKNARERGPALIGIELKNKDDFKKLLQRMSENNIVHEYLNSKPDLLQYLI